MYLKFTFVFGLILALSLNFSVEMEAQDPRFSQFYAAPMQLNPALTGVFEGRWRFNANYRDQWSSVLGSQPFRTVAAAFDMKYNVIADDYFAFGLSALHDEGGSSNLAIDRGHLNISYMKQMAGGKYRTDDQYLVAGAQLGFGQHNLNSNRLWFSAQFDEGTGTPDLTSPNLEGGITGDNLTSDVYMDFNAGILYYALFGDNTSIYVGGAMNHLNGPNVGLLPNSDEVLHTRWIGHAGGEIPFTTELSLMPAVQVMGQGSSFESNFGANIRYSNHDWYELAIRAGAWMRMTKTIDGNHFDAFVVAAILEVERWNLGASYDITSSVLTKANNSRGAFELSLIYTHPSKSRYKVNCPKF